MDCDRTDDCSTIACGCFSSCGTGENDSDITDCFGSTGCDMSFDTIGWCGSTKVG